MNFYNQNEYPFYRSAFTHTRHTYTRAIQYVVVPQFIWPTDIGHHQTSSTTVWKGHFIYKIGTVRYSRSSVDELSRLYHIFVVLLCIFTPTLTQGCFEITPVTSTLKYIKSTWCLTMKENCKKMTNVLFLVRKEYSTSFCPPSTLERPPDNKRLET